MKPATKQHIEAMKNIRHMTLVEIWRDTMCGNIKVIHGMCQTPDGKVEVGHCNQCRYLVP